MTNFLYLVLHWACKVTCYYQLVSSVLFSVLRTSTNVLSKSKSRNCVTWIPNVTKLFLSVDITEMTKIREPLVIVRVPYQLTYLLYKLTAWTQYHIFDMYETPIYWKFFSTYDLNPLFLLQQKKNPENP